MIFRVALCLSAFFGLVANEKLIQHVEQSVKNAELGISKIHSREILNLPGMSSPNVRHLLNNLCSVENVNYLEIGVWKGSTFVSALWNNASSVKNAIAIDNWSEFKQSESAVKCFVKKLLAWIPIKSLQRICKTSDQVFIQNVSQFLKEVPVAYYEADCFQIDKATVFKEKINIYFYDGNHSKLSQEMAFTYFDSILDNVFIAVVDDWNESTVQEGTRNAFNKLGYKVLYEKEFLGELNDKNGWWNGVYLGVIQK